MENLRNSRSRTFKASKAQKFNRSEGGVPHGLWSSYGRARVGRGGQGRRRRTELGFVAVARPGAFPGGAGMNR